MGKLLKAFFLGMVEFRSAFTTHYAQRDERWQQCEAYDWGREWAHRLTFRRFES